MDNQNSYASILRQNLAPPQSQDKAFTFSAGQLVKFVANVVIQVAQPQVCCANPTQDAIDKKSSLCRRVSEAAKNHLGVNITGINLFDAIGQLRPSAPPTSINSRPPLTKVNLHSNSQHLPNSLNHQPYLNLPASQYDTIKSDRSTGVRGGVTSLVKHGLVINKEYRNTDFNIITDNEALSNNQNLILSTIYCPNGNPNLRLFETINNLSDNVMFVGDFNSKLEAFGCAKKKHVWSDAQNYSKSTKFNLFKY